MPHLKKMVTVQGTARGQILLKTETAVVRIIRPTAMIQVMIPEVMIILTVMMNMVIILETAATIQKSTDLQMCKK